MSELKAYQVTEPMDGHAVVVFETNGAAARRKGAAKLEAAFEDIESCCRVPEFDAYAPGPVPPLVLIDNGWWFECLECNRRVSLDMEEELEDEGLDPASFQPVEQGSSVFCSSACQHKYETDKIKKAEAKAELERIFLEKFPGATVVSVHLGGHNLNDPYSGFNSAVYVLFTFPGSKRGNCKWVYGEEVCLISTGDLDAFQDWRHG